MPVLELSGVSKSFGAIRALSGVDLKLDKGEAIGLMGDNGAGKSTLMKIIAGNFLPHRGQHPHRRRRSPVLTSRSRRAERGIEIVYQDLALCDNLTAAGNVFLGRELKKKFGPIRWLTMPR
jgi:simple sugar transport system ATP-binding protein